VADTVRVRYVEIGAWQTMRSQPKATLRCGACGADWSQKLPHVNRPQVPCPACGRLNVVPIEPT
jgi:hypothetical protein